MKRRGFCHCWQKLLICKSTSLSIFRLENTRLLTMSIYSYKVEAIHFGKLINRPTYSFTTSTLKVYFCSYFVFIFGLFKQNLIGQWCGSVSRVVASNTRGPWFKSRLWKNLYWTMFAVNCTEKTKKRPGMNGPFKKIFLYKYRLQVDAS